MLRKNYNSFYKPLFSDEFMDIREAISYQKDYESKVNEACDYLKLHMRKKPDFGIILGSGLGDFSEESEWHSRVPYSFIPNFPTTNVPGHSGVFYFSKVEDVSVVFLRGRKHYYEVVDEPMNSGILQVVFPVHVLASLGIENLVVTNASGGLNLDYGVGDLMAIKSHINFNLPNPLMGREMDFKTVDGKPLERFVPMNNSYNTNLRKMFLDANRKYSERVHEGIYLGLTGPSYETEAECIAFRNMGADAVGMSTTPEVVVARSRGMNVLGVSCITDMILEDGTNDVNHDEVKAILNSPETKELFFESMNGFFREWKKSRA